MTDTAIQCYNASSMMQTANGRPRVEIGSSPATRIVLFLPCPLIGLFVETELGANMVR